MCGITGWIDWNENLLQRRITLEAMTDTLSHRGPDGRGYWISPRAALGHRHLRTEPDGNKQPLVRREGNRTYVITYNGRLYNLPELRQELDRLGHTFRTRSDAEVVLAAYIEWGPECLNRLNGVFALGIWDDRDQRLFLARDRFGIRPLFYTRRGGALLFGSELKALLANPLVPSEVNLEGLAEVFFLGPSRTPGHGVFRGTAEVKPGHYLIHEPSGTQEVRYWQLTSQPHTDDLPTTLETVRELVFDAVRRQIVSHQPVATLLSGGLDSSAISAVVAETFQEQGQAPLHTWSLDYRDNQKHFQASDFQPNSDSPWIRKVSQYLNTEHHDVVIDTPELVEALTVAVRARDLPGMADVDSSLYLFGQQIKPHFDVILSGECADEIFGGYPWFHREEALQNNQFPWIRMVSQRAALLAPELRQHLNPEEYIARRYQETMEQVPRLPGEEPVEARRRELFYLNFAWFMSTLLERKDRMTGAASLEARVPFCDHRIVQYAWNIPWSMKNLDGREKGLLRRALQGVLPDDVLHRRKSPFPKTHNPNYLRAVRTWLLKILADPASPLHQVIDTQAVRTLAQSPTTEKMPWFGQLMGLPQLLAYLAQINTWMIQYRISIR